MQIDSQSQEASADTGNTFTGKSAFHKLSLGYNLPAASSKRECREYLFAHQEFSSNDDQKMNVSSVSPGSSNMSSICTKIQYRVPWYFTAEYRRKHQLSLRDIRDMCQTTPIPHLLQLAMALACDMSQVFAPETMTDHCTLSFQHWFESVSNSHKKDGTTDDLMLFADNARLLTGVSNALMKFFQYESHGDGHGNKSTHTTNQNGGPNPADRLICPFDPHIPKLPVYLESDEWMAMNSQVGAQKQYLDEQWLLKEYFFGYTKWQNLTEPREFILIQSVRGHQALIKESKSNRRDIFAQKWQDRLFV